MALTMAIKIKRRRSLGERKKAKGISSTASRREGNPNSPLDERHLVPLPQKHLPDAASARSVAQVAHETEPEIPLERSREDLLTTSEEGNGERKVEHIFVEESDEVVFLPHDPIGNAKCTKKKKRSKVSEERESKSREAGRTRERRV